MSLIRLCIRLFMNENVMFAAMLIDLHWEHNIVICLYKKITYEFPLTQTDWKKQQHKNDHLILHKVCVIYWKVDAYFHVFDKWLWSHFVCQSLQCSNEEAFLQYVLVILNNLFSENLEEMFPLYYMDGDFLSRFKSSTYRCVTRRERVLSVAQVCYHRERVLNRSIVPIRWFHY